MCLWLAICSNLFCLYLSDLLTSPLIFNGGNNFWVDLNRLGTESVVSLVIKTDDNS
jgi:hypothetical protein